MKNLSKILKALMWDEGLTETELARRTHIGQPVIHRIASGETDNPKIATLQPIADYFKITISQLVGDDPLPRHFLNGRYGQKLDSWSKIPLLSWEQAANWPAVAKDIHAVKRVSTDADVGNEAFALSVEDTSMRPQFPEGTILILDPEREPKDGDFAVIHRGGKNKATFKKILIDGNTILMKPVNPDFKTQDLNNEDRFIGILVQTKSPRECERA